jgi:integrase
MPFASLRVTVPRMLMWFQAGVTLATARSWGGGNIHGWPKILNPFGAVPKFPEKRSRRYVPPEQDFWKVYEVSGLPARGIAGKQDQFILLTILHTAGRRKEIFRMTIADLNFSTNMIRLWTRKRKGGNLESDWIPMTSILSSGLLEWIRIRLIQDTENLFFVLMGPHAMWLNTEIPFLAGSYLCEGCARREKSKPSDFIRSTI